MPTYDYVCDACGHEFEVFQRMSDDKLTSCPECDGSVRRLIGGGSGVVFKGSGFYQTDYRSADYKKRAKADGVSTSSDKPASGTSSSGASTTGTSSQAPTTSPKAD